MHISLAQNTKHKYWNTHFKFVINLFKAYGAKIKYHPTTNKITFILGDKKGLIDYSDYSILEHDASLYDFIFKMHYSNFIEYPANVFPFTPMSFCDWAQFENIYKTYKYRAEGVISCRQRAYGNAIDRRKIVHDKLTSISNKYRITFEDRITGQGNYFTDIENILVSVHSPGATNNMLDRGQLQYMGLGVCTISPEIPEVLPYYTLLIPGTHYLICRDDYSDLEDIILWCVDNKEDCLYIGEQASKLFQDTCTPKKAIQWIEKCIDDK